MLIHIVQFFGLRLVINNISILLCWGFGNTNTPITLAQSFTTKKYVTICNHQGTVPILIIPNYDYVNNLSKTYFLTNSQNQNINTLFIVIGY